MALPPDLDHDKLCEAALAILGLTAHTDHGITRAWKGMDWAVLDELLERGWIADPKGKTKSVVLTDEGVRLTAQMLQKHFGK